MPDLTHQTIKGYQLLERIGSGGFGAVYRASQPVVGREVALKIIREEVADRPEFIRRFEIEAQLIARLEHLHIVPLYDFWRDPAGAYLVMRWMRSGSLAQVLETGPLDLATAARMMDQVASGLAAAHNHRIVHRDLKPSNILLDEEGNAYISDFGIAKDLAGSQPGVGAGVEFAGTLDYISPEQARGEEVSPRTDIYSLGVTLYEALAARHPFPGLNSVDRLYRHINDPLPPIDTLNPDVREAVNGVIQTATAKDPMDRFGGAPEMAAAFRAAARLGEEADAFRMEETLTPRESEILLQIIDGRTNKQIARDLFIELPTVKWHITQLYRKLGVRSRMQAVARARALDLAGADGQSGVNRPDSISISLAEPVNPYKGLRPFEGADSRDFFGREAVVDRLLERLGEEASGSRFLAVVGPSGSGKSSLLGAGLVPAIWGGRLPGSERWFVIEMTPGARPLDELEVSLTRIAADQAVNLHEHLYRDEAGLLRSAGLILPDDGSELFLVVDQFEELFTLTGSGQVRDHFLGLITTAVEDPRSRVRVVIALRADFYDRPLQILEFGALVERRMETLLPLSAADLERAIVQPAGQVGVTFESGLSSQIIEEILYQPGALPLLQYALTELFDRREERVLTRAAYEEIGGAGGALAGRAEEIYLQFDESGREASRQLFLRLVNTEDPSGDNQEKGFATRRRVKRSELLSLTPDPDVMDEVIDTFGAYRMISLDHDPASRQPIVELAHESLITEWQRLNRWVDQSRDDISLYIRLQALTQEWQAAGRDPGYLLREARLDQFHRWAERTDLVIPPDERQYLDASIAARGARQETEELRRQRELDSARKLAEAEVLRAEEGARANRRLRLLAAGLAAFLVVAVTAAGFAIVQSRRAEVQARLAFARELASAAIGALDDDPEFSIHLARRAVGTTFDHDGTVLPEAEEALHRAVQATRVLFTLPQGGGLAFSPDGTRLATGGEDGSITFWNPQTGERLGSIDGHTSPVTALAYSRDGSLIASAGQDYQRRIWDLESGEPILELPASDHGGPVLGSNTVAFSPDGKVVLSSSPTEEVEIWDVASGRLVAQIDDSAGPDAAFDPSGDRLALASAVWDVSMALLEDTTARPLVLNWADRQFDFADALIGIQAPSSENLSRFQQTGAVTFSPDGARLLATVLSSEAVVIDAYSGEGLFPLSGHGGMIHSVVFSPDGARLATASADGTARIWDAETAESLLTLEGHQDEVVRVAFSPDGERLATSSLDGTTKVWDLSPVSRGEWLSRYENFGETFVKFIPQTPNLVATGEGGRLVIVDIQLGETLFRADWGSAAIMSLAVSSDGSLLAVGDESGGVRILDESTGEQLYSFDIGRVVSSLAFSPTGSLLAAGGSEGKLWFWDVPSGELLGSREVGKGFINGLAFNSGGDRLITASFTGDGLILDLKEMVSSLSADSTSSTPGESGSEAIVASLNGPAGPFRNLEMSPDSERLVTAGWDGNLVVWDAQTGKAIHVMTGHGQVNDVAFRPDGERLASGGTDGEVILWDANSGEQLFILDSLETPVRSLDFSPDGKYLALGGSDGSVRAYVMPIQDLLDLSWARLTRELTPEECRRYLHLEECP